MAKNKITSNDFLRFLDDEESGSDVVAFAPKDKNDHKALAEREQSVSIASPKALAKGEQSVSKALAESLSKIESVSIASPKALAKGEQSVSKALAETDVLGLIGKEKKLLFFIYQKCEDNGSLETPIITSEDLLKYLEVSSVRLRNLIFRLQDQKNIIRVTQVHLGRSGWRRFSIEKDVFQIIRLHTSSTKALAEREQSVSIASPKALAYPLAGVPYSSSSSNIFNKITTTIEKPEISAELHLPDNLARFGISKNNLQKLISDGVCSFEVVQKSIEALSFDVEKGKTGNLAAILFGVLRSGKEYISQKQAEELSKELDFELKRINEAESMRQKLHEMRLKAQYEAFLEKTPEYFNEIKKRHGGLLDENSGLLETIAFEEFKADLNLSKEFEKDNLINSEVG